MYIKYLILIGRTFLATFFIVNFFNIVPLDLGNNAWFNQVSMLLVDTASFLLLGLVCIKICSLQFLDKYENIKKDELVDINKLIEKEEKGINLINKFSQYLMLFFIFLALFQFFIFFNGMNQINNQYLSTYKQIDNKYLKQKKILDLDLSNKNLNIEEINTKQKELNSIKNKRNKYLGNLDKNISKVRFLLFRGNAKVFLMSTIWSYGLFKLSKFPSRKGED